MAMDESNSAAENGIINSEVQSRCHRLPTSRSSNSILANGPTSPHRATIAGMPSAMTADETTPIIGGNSRQVLQKNYQSTDNLTREAVTPAEEDVVQPEPQNKNTNNSAGSASNGPREEEEDKDIRSPWHRRMIEKYGALELDNKGSVARDHLALERTFLAWLRTSLAFASIGIAVTQLFRLNTSITKSASSIDSNSSSSSSSALLPPSISDQSSTLLDLLLYTTTATTQSSSSSGNNSNRLRNVGKPLGATFIGVGILILLIGFHRYFEAQYWIVRGKFPASRGSVAIVTFVAAALIVASLVVILAIAPGVIEQ